MEFVHYVRIVEFQSWNNVKGDEQKPFQILPSEPYDVSDPDTIRAKFYEKCMYASLGSCDMNVVRAVDEEGNVWQGLEAIIRHVKNEKKEETK